MTSMKNLMPTACLIIALFTGCGERTSAQNPPEKIERTTNVLVYPIIPDTLIQYSRLPATVKAWRDVTLSALETGVARELLKDVGDMVRRGEPLARLKIDVLEASAIEAEADLKFQAYNYERSKHLFAEGSISEQAHYAAEYDYRRAESAAQIMRHRLSYGQIEAPFSGLVAQRLIELGQLVSQGSPTFRLVQIDRLRLEVWVAESEIADFSSGSAIELTLDSFPGETHAGAIGHIGPAAQSDQRVFPIEIHLDNPHGRIRPGMIGKIKAVRRVFRNMVVVPREAVLERETGPVAFVVKNDQAHLRHLVLGPSEGDRVLVQEGLQFGDQLIIKGGRDLIHGDRVIIQHREMAP